MKTRRHPLARVVALGLTVAPLAPNAWGCSSASDASSSASQSSVSSSASSSTSSGTGGASACLACGSPKDLGPMANPAITEASGLAASKLHPGAYYVHNDSGDSARFFALGSLGEDLGTYVVSGATAIDWEDIARGPCADPNKSCIYLGDMGDNLVSRSSYVLYRTEEPAALAAGMHTVTHETFTFTYEDGPHNAEALLVHPSTGAVTIVTKAASGPVAYELPLPLVTGMVAKRANDVPIVELLPLVTAGDVNVDASGVLLRTYGSLYYFAMKGGETVAAALAREPCSVPVAMETQGEAVAWKLAGTGWITTSEGAAQHLSSVDCP